jgi:hypothetical protein
VGDGVGENVAQVGALGHRSMIVPRVDGGPWAVFVPR